MGRGGRFWEEHVWGGVVIVVVVGCLLWLWGKKEIGVCGGCCVDGHDHMILVFHLLGTALASCLRWAASAIMSNLWPSTPGKLPGELRSSGRQGGRAGRPARKCLFRLCCCKTKKSQGNWRCDRLRVFLLNKCVLLTPTVLLLLTYLLSVIKAWGQCRLRHEQVQTGERGKPILCVYIYYRWDEMELVLRVREVKRLMGLKVYRESVKWVDSLERWSVVASVR